MPEIKHVCDYLVNTNVIRRAGLITIVKTIGERTQHARERRGITQAQLADAAGVAQGTIGNLEAGRTKNTPRELLAIARALGVRPDWLESGKMPMAASNTETGPAVNGKVPLISWVQAGAWSSTIDNYSPGDAEEWVETTVPIHQHTYALRVRGDSMTNPTGDPSFPDGSIIIVEPDSIAGIEAMVGRFVIVKRAADEETTFKKLVKDGGAYFLRPLNPQFPMMQLGEDDIFCGVVREKIMRFF